MRLIIRCLGCLVAQRRLALLLGLLMLCDGLLAALPVLLVQRCADPALDAIGSESMAPFYWFVSALVGSLLLYQFFAYARKLVSRKLANLVVADLREKAVGNYLRMSLAYFNKGETGEAVLRTGGDATAVWSLAMLLCQTTQNALVLAGLAAAVISRNPFLGLVGFVFLPVAALPLVTYSRRIRAYAKEARSHRGDIAGMIAQVFAAMRVVIAYGREKGEAARIGLKIRDLLDLRVKATRSRATARALVQIINYLGMVLILLVGAHLLASGYLRRGEILAVLMAVYLLRGRVSSIAASVNQTHELLPQVERVFEILDLEPDMADAPSAVEIDGVHESICFENVCFSYGSEVVLDGISFTVPVGATCAVVGASGAGKSALLDLVPRFYDPTSGRLLVDGRDIREVRMASLRKQVAVVTQDPFLFMTSIGENIRFGRPDAGDEDVRNAARAAGIHEDIVSLPDGYDTVVGERGLTLSGGQRQRIAIARAVIREAPVLLLDEAMSSLDSVAEREVSSALKELMAGRTTFVAAHRLGAISDADMIVVLRDGRTEGVGRHAELLETCAAYRELWDAQRHKGPEQIDPADLFSGTADGRGSGGARA